MGAANFLELSWQAWLTLAVVAGVFGGTALSRMAPDTVFLGALVVLFASGVLDVADALRGFANPGMITVGTLYVVAAGLQQTGGLAWISHRVLGRPNSTTRALIRLMAPVMGVSAFLNNTPVVAMFIPIVAEWSRKLRMSPSRLMIPLSYAAICGGVCTLVGTSTNLVVNGMLIADAGKPGLRMFDITFVSLPCALVAFGYILLAGRRLLPERKPAVAGYEDARRYTVEMILDPSSPLAGQTIEQAGLRHLPGLFLAEIARGGRVIAAVAPDEVLRAEDRLIFAGVVDSIADLRKFRGLRPATDQVFKLAPPRSDRCLIEAVVSNTCPNARRSIRDGRFRTRYNAVVLSVAREGERVGGKIGDIVLEPGDVLLLEAHPSFLDRRRVSRDFYLISRVPDSEPLRHRRAPVAALVLAGMVAAAATGQVSMLKAAMIAAVLMVGFGCCSLDRARRSVQWHVLLVIAAALGIGRALFTTGAAAAIGALLLRLAGGNPWGLLAAVYGLTTVLTEVMTNSAAAALVFPIALAASRELGVSFMPFAVAIMIGASASFATPIGYQTNLMVYGPGGYRFGDFARVGVPLNLLFWGTTVLIAPLVYPF